MSNTLSVACATQAHAQVNPKAALIIIKLV